MIKHIQFVRGTTVQNDKYTGPDGEITIDTDTHTIRIHDGSKAGGYPLNGSDPALAAKVTNLEKTSLTKTEAASTYLGKTAKAASATVADSATKATYDASGNVITTTYASKSENNSKVAISGNRGQLAGMETPADGTVVNGTSADSMTATGNITVQTGVANTAWTKAVTINNASYTVSLGGSWHWVGGKAPEIKVPGILVCHWNSSVGLANYISGAA